MNAKSHSGPARAAHDALRQLASLEKDIPVVKALSNPRFKDRHWRKVGNTKCEIWYPVACVLGSVATVRFTCSPDASPGENASLYDR